MKCFLQDRLGRIHDKVGNVIFFREDGHERSFEASFSDDQEFPDRGFRETYPEREVEHITFMLKRLFRVLEALLEAVAQYEDILQDSSKKILRKQSTMEMTVTDY